MKTSKWLCVNHNGVVKIFSKKPHVGPDEVAIQMVLDIPDAVFNKPTFKAVLQFEEGEAPDISQIETSVVAEAIQEATGFKVEIVVPDPEPTEPRRVIGDG